MNILGWAQPILLQWNYPNLQCIFPTWFNGIKHSVIHVHSHRALQMVKRLNWTNVCKIVVDKPHLLLEKQQNRGSHYKRLPQSSKALRAQGHNPLGKNHHVFRFQFLHQQNRTTQVSSNLHNHNKKQTWVIFTKQFLAILGSAQPIHEIQCYR